MKKRTTIDDVAKTVGVSRQTVSRAINGLHGISDTTRDRVLEAVDALGYRPSRLAQGMASSQTRTIGLIIGNITNPGHANVVRGLQDIALSHNYNVFLRSTDYNVQNEMEAVHSLIAEDVDGLVFVGSQLTDDALKQITEQDIPSVVVHRDLAAPYISSILTDVERATKTVVEYFFGTRHQMIGLLTRKGQLDNIRNVRGYRRAYIEHGREVSNDWIFQSENTLEGGYLGARHLLAAHPNMTALLAYNDLMAIGAMKACIELERPIPESVAVFGYDDIALASYTNPPLSTVRFKGYDVGICAMERILEMLAQPEAIFPPVIIDIELVIRASSSRQ